MSDGRNTEEGSQRTTYPDSLKIQEGLLHQSAEFADAMTSEELETVLEELRKEREAAEVWETDRWKGVVPGKRVLQKVAETLAGEGSTLQVRNVTIGLMAKDGHKPVGMLRTIQKALVYRREERAK